MITEEQVAELARYFKIDEATIVREYLQLSFLRSFYSLKPSEHIFFKGGTAIHFHYGSFRFSEDLDFTAHQKSGTLEKMLVETVDDMRSEIKELSLGKITRKPSSLVSQLRTKYKGRALLTVRLEFSLREKVLTHAASIIETRFPLVSYPLVVHLEAEELLAEKIRAVLTRSKGRDFFDLWYLLSKGIKIREDFVSKKLKWYKKEYKKEDLIETIKKAKEKELYDDLAKFLPKNYRGKLGKLKEQILSPLGAGPADL